MRGTVGDLIVDILRREGVRHVFGLVGSPMLPLMEALARTPEIQYISAANEHGAALMAEGYGRFTRRPGICIATMGGAATSLVTGMAQGRSESTPMVAIVVEVSTRHWGFGYSNRHNLDQTSLFRVVAKQGFRIERADRVADTFRSAFRIAITGRPGPVYVGVPRDVLASQIAWEPWKVDDYLPPLKPAADVATLRRGLELLMAAERPLILAGGGVRCAAAESLLVAVAERLSIPVVATQENKGVIPEDHPLSAYNVGEGGNNPVALQAVREADAILALGATFSEWTTAQYGHEIIPSTARIVQVDIDPGEVGKLYPVEIGIVGDLGVVLEQALGLLDEVSEQAELCRRRLEGGWVQRVSTAKESWRAEIRREAEAPRPGIGRLRLLQELRQALDRDAIVISDGGSTWLSYGFEALAPVYGDGDFCSLGGGICTAIAAKLAEPRRQVVIVAGDGSYMMTQSELWTAVRYHVPVAVVVLHNNAYGNILQSQLRRYGCPYGTELDVPDLASNARSMGAYGERVERVEDLQPALKRALGADQPALLDVLVDDAATDGWTPRRRDNR